MQTKARILIRSVGRLKSCPDTKHKSRIDNSQKIRKNVQKRLATHSDQSQSMPKEQ